MSQLEAYLFNWQGIIFDQDENWQKLASIGRVWGNKYLEDINGQKLLEIEAEYEELFEKLKNDEGVQKAINEGVTVLENRIKNSEKQMRFAFRVTDETRLHMLEGRIFPQDNELACLPPHMAKLALRLKLKTIDVHETMLFTYRQLEDGETNEKVSEQILEIGKLWTKVIRDRTILESHCESVMGTPTLLIALGLLSGWE